LVRAGRRKTEGVAGERWRPVVRCATERRTEAGGPSEEEKTMFSARLTSSETSVVWKCEGPLDSYSGESAQRSLEEIPPSKSLILDLTGCYFLDGHGVALLLQAIERADPGEVVIRVTDFRVLQALRVSGVDRRARIEVVPGSEGASKISRLRSSRRGLSYRTGRRYSFGRIQTLQSEVS
jgi:anti-anti-sigma regulatory factor